LFGNKQEEIIGRPLTVLMPSRFKENHERGLAAYLCTGKSGVIGRTVEMVGLTKAGAGIL
jgi:hypothetical protein